MALNSNFRTLTADNIEGIVDDRNYLKSSFENGTITGWTEVAVTLTSGLPTGTPTIGATAASSLALSATSVTPLSGSRSLLVDVPSALTAGHGFISDEFTLDRMDLGKVLTVSFDYERVTGTYNFSGTLGSQTWMVYIYDATLGAANWIQPAGFLGMNQSSGPGRIRATFQSSVTAGQKYRVAVIASQAASGASSIEFDNFTCSRQTAPIGPVVTDFQSYTATTSGFNIGTTGTATTRWRRVGDSIHVIGRYVAGGTGISVSGDLRVFLPTGLSFDTSKISLFSTVGAFELHNAGAYRYGGATLAVDTTQVAFSIRQNAATLGNFAGTQTPEVGWFNAGNDEISFEFMAPISGWSSNVQLSNDTDTRVVDFRAYTTTARTVNNSAPTIIFENVEKDSHGAYNASTGVYTVPVSGDYVVSGQMRIGSLTMTAGAFFGFSAAVDGVYTVRHHYTAFRAVVASSAFNFAEGSGSVLLPNLRAGQTIQVRAWGDNATATFTDGANSFCIQRISGPSVVAASETVACKYTVEGARAPTHASDVVVAFDTKDFDTHNMASGLGTNTFRLTAPVSGTYQVSFAVSISGKINVNQLLGAYTLKNGSVAVAMGSAIPYFFGLSADRFTSSGAGLVKLNAGEYIECKVYSFRADGTVSNYLTGSQTQISFVRVGN